jgi:hypothetical protein
MRSVAGLYLPTRHAALGGRSPPGDTTNRPTEGPGRQHTTRCVTVEDGPEVPPGKVGSPVLRAEGAQVWSPGFSPGLAGPQKPSAPKIL